MVTCDSTLTRMLPMRSTNSLRAPIALPTSNRKNQIMKHSLGILALGLALTLSACGSPAPDAAPAAPEQSVAQPSAPSASASVDPVAKAAGEALGAPMEYEEGALTGTEFAFAINNTFGKFTLPGKPDPELAPLIAKLDGAVATFVTVTVDNREGFDEAFINSIRGYDAAGEEYVFERAIDVVGILHDELTDSQMSYDKYSELFDKHDGSAARGQVKEFLMVSGDELPESFKRIAVDAGGLVGEVDAVTLAEGVAQGMPLEFVAP